MIGKLLERTAAGEPRREIAITKEEFLIGRGSDCDLRLGVSAVSRHHCLLRIRNGEATLADLGSANGTFVNGARLRSTATLQHGDEIGVGDFHFVLELSGQSGILWGPATDARPDMPTIRVKDLKRQMPASEPKKDEGHPPGEAGGQ
jgi:pSer/pThr/pTyr-binding forkhead associated (FHA) protein